MKLFVFSAFAVPEGNLEEPYYDYIIDKPVANSLALSAIDASTNAAYGMVFEQYYCLVFAKS